MNSIYMTATNCLGLLSISINNSHTSQSAIAQIETLGTSLDIGDAIEVYLGYNGSGTKVFTGYVKHIEEKEPPRTISLTCSDVMVRAMDFFIAASDPENPFKRKNIKAEDLVRDVMALAGLTNYSGDNTLFTFGINNDVEVNLASSYDYSRFIADILAYNIYADLDGQIHFTRRLPYVTGGDSPVGTINKADCLTMAYSKTDKDLRNRVVVYGADNIHAEASASSPYLPPGFYKSVVVAAPTVFDNQGMAQQAADYNLELLNRLTQSVSITMPGAPAYYARSVVTVNNADLGVSGDWYVYSVSHTANSSGFITSLEVRS